MQGAVDAIIAWVKLGGMTPKPTNPRRLNKVQVPTQVAGNTTTATGQALSQTGKATTSIKTPA